MKTFLAIFISSMCSFCFILGLNAQWSEQTSGITTSINSVSAVDDNVVWACGNGGVVLMTLNSGINWSVLNNLPVDLYCIQGIDAMTALVGGSNTTSTFAYKTIDGGATWTQTFSQAGGFINAIKKFNGFPVYGLQGDPVGGRWTQFVSFDFGSTWDSTNFYNPAPPGEAGWNNSFFAATPAYFSYYGTNNTKIYQPFANGSILSHPTPGLLNSYSIWGNDNSRLMSGGDNEMLYTIDGGFSWTNVNAIGAGRILGICGAYSKWYYTRGSSIYYSSNDGVNWSNDYTATGEYYHIALSPFGRYIWAVRSNGGISRNMYDPPLPVELSSFTSSVNLRDVNLNWSTVTEENNYGFDIERSSSKGLTNTDWNKVGFVEGNGTAVSSINYSFTDRGLSTGIYNYRLKQIDFNGNFNYYNLGNEVAIGVPDKYSLSQNYPNPFNPSTKINFNIPFDGNVSLKVFDMTGREINTIVNEVKTAGYYTVSFNASGFSSGVYYYTINADGNGNQFTETRKMMLIK
ncbi:MAG: T9SS type A sorting domain-containing protein [Ignavibacteria bacterium]